jgi:hypothetical protein
MLNDREVMLGPRLEGDGQEMDHPSFTIAVPESLNCRWPLGQGLDLGRELVEI